MDGRCCPVLVRGAVRAAWGSAILDGGASQLGARERAKEQGMLTVSVITYVILAVVGLLYCFRGERFLRVFMLIYGVMLGYTYSMRLFAQMGADGGQWMWVVALGIGVAIGMLAFFFLKAAIFLAGGLLGLALFRAVQGADIAGFAAPGTSMSFLVGLGFFLICGALTLVARRHLVRIGTAFYGAFTFTEALGVLIAMAMRPGYVAPVTSYSGMGFFGTLPAYVAWIIVLALAIWGMAAQYRVGRSRRR